MRDPKTVDEIVGSQEGDTGVSHSAEGDPLGYHHIHDSKKGSTVTYADAGTGRTARKQMLTFGQNLLEDCLGLAEKKNNDYSAGNDPFMNLRRGGPFGIAVRMDDKVSRILSLLRQEGFKPSVDESLEDTCMDIINYAWLLLALRKDLRG